MKIRMKTLMSGPDGNFYPGQECDFPKKMAEDLVKEGFAESLEKSAEKLKKTVDVESASYEPEEKAVIEKPKPRKNKGKKPPEEKVTP